MKGLCHFFNAISDKLFSKNDNFSQCTHSVDIWQSLHWISIGLGYWSGDGCISSTAISQLLNEIPTLWEYLRGAEKELFTFLSKLYKCEFGGSYMTRLSDMALYKLATCQFQNERYFDTVSQKSYYNAYQIKVELLTGDPLLRVSGSRKWGHAWS